MYLILQEQFSTMIKRLPEFFLKCAKPNAISYWTYQPRYNFAENNENENKPKLPPINSQKEPLKFNGIRIIALLVGTSWILILGIYMNAEKFLMAARNNEPLPVRDSSTSQAALPEEYRSEYVLPNHFPHSLS